MTAVRVQFLGSGDAFASGGRFQACLLLDGEPEPLLIDCGATGLVALKQEGIDPNLIGWVAVSHLHGDHFAGLPWLILLGQFSGRARPLVIAAPPGARERIERTLAALYPGAAEQTRAFETRFEALSEGRPTQLGCALVDPVQVSHGSGAPAFALRIRYGGKVIGYSGDTEWTESLISVADGADLFICECNFFEPRGPGHLDYRTLSANRGRLRCKRIVITHMGEEVLSRLSDIDLEAAQDGAVITV